MAKSKKDNEFAFEAGWAQLPASLQITVRGKIMKALDLKSPASFYYRLHGKTEPLVSESKKIEAIFNDYGIVSNIWGNA